MQTLKLIILPIMLGLIIYGSEKKEIQQQTQPQVNPITEKPKEKKETDMKTTLQWLGHASFKITCNNKIIYIDPWKLKDSPHDATVVLVSHSHHDHYSANDIARVSDPNTKLIASADVIDKEKKGQAMKPGQTIELEGIKITSTPAYNLNKKFHPKANNWLGFVIEIGSKRIYYAGDTDLTEEMKALEDIDVALLPVGGTYTMNADEAAEATKYIKPKMAIPYHFGDIVGSQSDAEKFAKLAQCNVKVLKPGDMTNVE